MHQSFLCEMLFAASNIALNLDGEHRAAVLDQEVDLPRRVLRRPVIGLLQQLYPFWDYLPMRYPRGSLRLGELPVTIFTKTDLLK